MKQGTGIRERKSGLASDLQFGHDCNKHPAYLFRKALSRAARWRVAETEPVGNHELCLELEI